MSQLQLVDDAHSQLPLRSINGGSKTLSHTETVVGLLGQRVNATPLMSMSLFAKFANSDGKAMLTFEWPDHGLVSVLDHGCGIGLFIFKEFKESKQNTFTEHDMSDIIGFQKHLPLTKLERLLTHVANVTAACPNKTAKDLQKCIVEANLPPHVIFGGEPYVVVRTEVLTPQTLKLHTRYRSFAESVTVSVSQILLAKERALRLLPLSEMKSVTTA